jgi:hypothetical protein
MEESETDNRHRPGPTALDPEREEVAAAQLFELTQTTITLGARSRSTGTLTLSRVPLVPHQ